jgi:hypothetical protein
MSSETFNKQTLATIKADYLARHGMELDDWSALILLDNQAQFQNMGNQLTIVLEENRKLSSKIRESVKTVQFTSIREAFIYGIGQSLPYSVTGLLLGIIYYVYMSTYVEYDNIKAIVKRYENVADYEQLMREGLTEIDDGIEYLILKPSKDGKYIFGESYEFDQKRKLVKVPLKRKN